MEGYRHHGIGVRQQAAVGAPHEGAQRRTQGLAAAVLQGVDHLPERALVQAEGASLIEVRRVGQAPGAAIKVFRRVTP